MDNSFQKRRSLNGWLFMFSGFQMLMALYYDWDIAWGSDEFQKLIGDKFYPTFKYGCYSLFLSGLLYHCMSKPLYRGSSGFPFQYVAILLNFNQLCSIICFFFPILIANPKNGFVYFQMLVYIPTLVVGSLMNYYGWNKVQVKSITLTGSFLLSRRRDWGIAGTLLSACQMVLLFWSCVKCFIQPDWYKESYGDYFRVYSIALLFMIIGALGYHVLGLKVSKGGFPCHRRLNLVSLTFASIELVGLILYILSCTLSNMNNIFYYHGLFFGAGMVVSAFGNSYISRLKLDEDIQEFERLSSDKTLDDNLINTPKIAPKAYV